LFASFTLNIFSYGQWISQTSARLTVTSGQKLGVGTGWPQEELYFYGGYFVS